MDIERENEVMRKAYHDKGFRGKNVIFGHFDTGAEENHPEYAGRVVDFPFGKGDNNGHGTFTLGQLISTNYGMCPDAKAIVYWVLENPSKPHTDEAIIEALIDFKNRIEPTHAYIANMSLSGDWKDPTSEQLARYEKAINDIVAAGGSVFVAAGNDGTNNLNKYPSCFYAPITVAAVDKNGDWAGFSTWHKQVDFSDFGVNVTGICLTKYATTSIFGGKVSYKCQKSGTSMSTPFSAGKAGLIQDKKKIQTNKFFTDDELFDELKKMAVDLKNTGFDPYTGFGLVQLSGADYKEEPSEPPVVEPPKEKPIEYVLKVGDKGDKVKELQNLLLALGYPVGKIDGDYGPITKGAVKLYQHDRGLPETGNVDQDTWDTFLPPKPPEEEPIEEPTPPPVDTTKPNVLDFIKWALTHIKSETIPTNAVLPLPLVKCGTDSWEYLFGTTGRKVTLSLLNAKFNDPYSGWGWSRKEYDTATKGWLERGVTACDCQGLVDAYFTQVLGITTDNNARGNYANWCTEKSEDMNARPYVLGEAVFVYSSASKQINHVGFICGFTSDGDPLVAEERGLAYGCVITNLRKRNFNRRGLMTKKFNYEQLPEEPKEPEEPPVNQPVDPPDKRDLYLSTPIMEGEDVKALQEKLIGIGFNLGSTGADGKYGKKTNTAVQILKDNARKVTSDNKVDESVRKLLNL
jgi:peptidoglycan hydrolase-like protein with peptidoglycan-binding domain